MTERVDPSLCEGEDNVFHEISQIFQHQLSLLLNMAQSNRKPLPVGCYTERMVMQVIDRVAGVKPLSVTIVNERESMAELKEDDPIIDVSQLIQGLASWKGQSVNVSCIISSKRSLLSIIQEGDKTRNKQKELEKEQQSIRDGGESWILREREAPERSRG